MKVTILTKLYLQKRYCPDSAKRHGFQPLVCIVPIPLTCCYLVLCCNVQCMLETLSYPPPAPLPQGSGLAQKKHVLLLNYDGDSDTGFLESERPQLPALSLTIG